jgi:uncharacterized UBP type Zn finger protein
MSCHHFDHLKPVPSAAVSYRKGCEDCLKIGGTWVHLRICLTCGHVGCCDSSPHKHATAHFRGTKHPVITSGEAGETWAYCYADDQFLSAE